jgi:hypothetical protein
MRRAAQANWSRLPNHNPPRFYTAWTQSRHSAASVTQRLVVRPCYRLPNGALLNPSA